MTLLGRLDVVIEWIQPRPGTELDAELRAIRAEIEKEHEDVRSVAEDCEYHIYKYGTGGDDPRDLTWIVQEFTVRKWAARLREAMK